MNISATLNNGFGPVRIVDINAEGSMAYIVFIDAAGNLRCMSQGFSNQFSSATSGDSVIALSATGS